LRSWRKLSTAFRPKCACLSIASTDLKRGWIAPDASRAPTPLSSPLQKQVVMEPRRQV
jgi:hypothetical protein